MLSAAVTACVDCRQGNCVHLSLDPAESPAGRQSLTGGAGRGRRPGLSPLQIPSDGGYTAFQTAGWGMSAGRTVQ
jgi:hypothetical protein